MAGINKIVYWTPRILSIIFILFLMMFSLDVFEPGLSAWEITIGLFMHNIPAFILAAIVWISWKHEIVGAIAFILAGMIYVILLTITISMDFPNQWNRLFWTLPISLPAFIVGILFLINWIKKKKGTRY
jgi:hypothetical protein